MDTLFRPLRRSLLSRAVAAASLVMASNAAVAQITTDGTVGAAQALVGPNFVIPENLGTLTGTNLFHSFWNFNINTGETATFTTTTTNLDNVISRVTGGDPSTINGALTLDAVGTPSFYFINPAGVMFGEGASVNVPGAFRLSTGDYLLFADDSRYAGNLIDASTVTTAPPEAFGFLTDNSGVLDLSNVHITAGDGQNITFSSAGVQLVDSSLTVPGGVIALSATGGLQTETPVSAASVDGAGSGTLTLNNSSLNTSSDGPGQVQLSADAVNISASSVTASNTGAVSAAGQVGLVINTDALTVGGGSLLSTDALGAGDAPDLIINASDSVSITGTGQLASDTFGAGNAGAVIVNTGDLIMNGLGAPNALISSDALTGSTGHAGAVSVAATGQVQMIDGGRITSDTDGTGNAGFIGITADNLNMDGSWTAILSEANPGSTGEAGAILAGIFPAHG